MQPDLNAHQTAEREALARCFECFDDGQDTDVERPMLDKLTVLGWLDRTGRNRWEISFEGLAVLNGIEVHNV